MNDLFTVLLILGFFALVIGLPAILVIFGFSFFRKKLDELDEEEDAKINKQKRSLFFYFEHFLFFTVISSIIISTLLFPSLDPLPTEIGVLILVCVSLTVGFIVTVLYLKKEN